MPERSCPGRAQHSRARSRSTPTRRTRCVTLGRAHMLPGGDLDRASALLLRAVQLAPGREDYRLILAHAYIRQGDRVRATAQLEALVAGGIPGGCARPGARDARRHGQPECRARRRQPGSGASLERRRANPSNTGTGAGASRASRSQPDLRRVGPGETRVRGIFRSVECRPAIRRACHRSGRPEPAAFGGEARRRGVRVVSAERAGRRAVRIAAAGHACAGHLPGRRTPVGRCGRPRRRDRDDRGRLPSHFAG